MKRALFVAIYLIITLSLVGFPLKAVAQDGSEIIEFTLLETDDGLMRLLYPTEWTFEVPSESGSIFLYSDEAISERSNDAQFESNEVSVVLTFIPSDFAHLFGFTGDTLEEKLTRIVDGLIIIHTDEDGMEHLSVGEIEVAEASDESPEMALIRYSLRDTADGMLIIWNVADDLLGAAIASTAHDELTDSESIILTIVQSVEFTGSIDELLVRAAADGEGDN